MIFIRLRNNRNSDLLTDRVALSGSRAKTELATSKIHNAGEQQSRPNEWLETRLDINPRAGRGVPSVGTAYTAI